MHVGGIILCLKCGCNLRAEDKAEKTARDFATNKKESKDRTLIRFHSNLHFKNGNSHAKQKSGYVGCR
jgi:hypothetical protein